jgi:hypothetical protein
VPRQLFSGGAVFRSKSAIHSLILLARCPHWRMAKLSWQGCLKVGLFYFFLVLIDLN